MLKALYVLAGILLIGGYVYAGVRGVELRRTEKGFVAGGVRGMHGGARTFWYGGYRGGK